ncbi:hypothetical protein MGAST_09230 [Mycobacterium gastri 'Wayne']|nr:hypothetical protein MGAST_09230 [Mycobacterium gastri 'Wayne']
MQSLGAKGEVTDTGAVHCETEGSHGSILSAGRGVPW